MKTLSNQLISGAALMALATLAQAQPTAHYVPGVEGIKAASLPPPGVYVRDYNVFYTADQLNGPTGSDVSPEAPGGRAFLYANVPRVIWITDQQLFGGFLGLDALIPLQYTEIKRDNFFHDQTFGLGDFMLEGTWSKHLDRVDLALGYAFYAPTGDSAPPPSTRAGLGYWTHMLTAGATVFFDADKRWALSALNRYEFNTENHDTDITPGQAYTLEWGLSYAANQKKTIDLGVVGYYQQQVNSDTHQPAALRDRVAAIGPEVSLFCSKLGVNTSIRYLYEFMAESRFQGHTIAITFTKRF
jgi:hypothetical protein